jgi:hypothetical protein
MVTLNAYGVLDEIYAGDLEGEPIEVCTRVVMMTRNCVAGIFPARK